MKLTVQQCVKICENPANAIGLQAARMHEQRLQMHVEPFQERAEMPAAFTHWLNWIKSFLPADKFAQFEKLIRFPLETVQNTSSIFEELSKVFETPDSFTRFNFTAPAYEAEFMEYIGERLNDENFWNERGFQALKTGINGFMIIDTPAIQRTTRPQAYYYYLGIKSVHDVVIDSESGEVEYIAIYQRDGSILIIDELAYRRMIRPEGSGTWILAEGGERIHSTYQQTEIQTPEGIAIQYGDFLDGIGYTPACSFYEHIIQGSSGINKYGPISPALGNLDKLLFKIISQDYFELYGSYPVVVAYKETCDYRDKDGNECVAGYVNSEQLIAGTSDSYAKCQTACPVCVKSGLIGPGSRITVDPPKDNQDADLMVNPIKFIEPGTDLLEFGLDKIKILEDKIELSCIGFLPEATKEAINEKQVKSQFEKRKAILKKITRQIDSTRKFCLETIARIMYGRYFVSASIFGGQEYFLQDSSDIATEYAEGKKAGLPSWEIGSIRASYTNTKYKSNPAEKERAFILSHLEPYPDQTVQELRNLGINVSEPIAFLLKLDFLTFINQFERDFGSIVEVGSLSPFNVKIDIIRGKLLELAGERVQKFVEPKAEPIV